MFQTNQQNISQHIRNIFEEGELTSDATHKKFLSIGREGLKSAFNTSTPSAIAVARKMPEKIVQKDPKLFMWYDQALIRTKEAIRE